MAETRMQDHVDRGEPPLGAPTLPDGDGYPLVDDGATWIDATPEEVWAIVMDEHALAERVPKAKNMRRTGETSYAADVSLGVGPLRAVYLVEADLEPLSPPHTLRILGGAKGRFGNSRGEAIVRLSPAEGGTRLVYRYAIRIGGAVGRLGGPILQNVGDTLIAKFFRAFATSKSETDSS